LPPGQRTSNHFDRIEAEDSHVLLIIRVKVRDVMR
jgi:hypothetical protein